MALTFACTRLVSMLPPVGGSVPQIICRRVPKVTGGELQANQFFLQQFNLETAVDRSPTSGKAHAY